VPQLLAERRPIGPDVKDQQRRGNVAVLAAGCGGSGKVPR
jgi:hypothetical protein